MRHDLIEQQQLRIDELSATVERLRIAALNAISVMPSGQAKADLRDAYDDTPEQNLNAVKRSVFADGYYKGFSDGGVSNHDWQQDHINYGKERTEIVTEQEYPKGKER